MAEKPKGKKNNHRKLTWYQTHVKINDIERKKRHKELLTAIKIISKWSVKITNGHIKNREGRAWTMHQQLMHTVSEVAEVYEAIRQGKCDLEILGELWDCVLASLTNITIYYVTLMSNTSSTEYEKIFRKTFLDTIKKVENRLSETAYKVE